MNEIRIWTGGRIATCKNGQAGLGVIDDGALVTEGDVIVYAGPAAEMPSQWRSGEFDSTDLEGAWVTPGLIDCHTHLVFGGDRSLEFERRLEGASYAELQEAGGGIFGTVNATRTASDEELYQSAATRLNTMSGNGVTTVEIKSGYGLDPQTELRMLRIAKKLRSNGSLPDVISTCLAAHALPPEYADRRDEYLQQIITELLPAVKKESLATTVDAFGEHIAFTPEEINTLFEAAKALGFDVKLHADQLSDQNGAAIAAQFQALSADHLEFTSTAGVAAMSQSATVAVLLPVAFYTLREIRLPPIEEMRRLQVPMAVATDANPGSAPTSSLLLAMNMACVLFGLTVEEAVLGVTRHAAQALGLEDRGTLEAGRRADFCIWSVGRLAELVYWTGQPRLTTLIRGGQVC